MLRVDDLHVQYGRILALRGISIEVREGERVGLIGANGAGKSTLLATVMGLLRPTAGSVTMDGVSVVGSSPENIVRRGISLVPEGRRIFGTLTVEENLRMGITARRDGLSFEAASEPVFDRFPVLRSMRRTTASRLSGGEQQQLAIARALLGRPKLLLLDEPSLGLAPIVIDDLFDLLGELNQDGVTMLMVEQNALRTVEFADRTYVLRTGEIVLSGSRHDLLESSDLASTYLGF